MICVAWSVILSTLGLWQQAKDAYSTVAGDVDLAIGDCRHNELDRVDGSASATGWAGVELGEGGGIVGKKHSWTAGAGAGGCVVVIRVERPDDSVCG